MNDTYITKDLGEAAYILSGGARFKGLLKTEEAEFLFFTFGNPVLCQELKNEYWMGKKVLMSPLALVKSYRLLIRRINEGKMKSRT